MGLCDVVLSREIWPNCISELRPRIEIYRKVRAERSPPWKSDIQILVSEDQSWGIYYFSNCAHFFARDIIWDVLALFVTGYTQFLQYFLGSKNLQKDKNMMSCTRLYVESTDILRGEWRKWRLLSLPTEGRESMSGKKSFLIIITSKGSNQTFKKVEN